MVDLTCLLNFCDAHFPFVWITHGWVSISAGSVAPLILPECGAHSSGTSAPSPLPLDFLPPSPGGSISETSLSLSYPPSSPGPVRHPRGVIPSWNRPPVVTGRSHHQVHYGPFLRTPPPGSSCSNGYRPFSLVDPLTL